jgi:hypothetical protein
VNAFFEHLTSGASMNFNKSLLVAATLGLSVTTAQADIIWDWKINNPIQVVSITEVVLFTGTLYNDLSSSSRLSPLIGVPGLFDQINLFSAQGDFTPDKYSFHSGPIGLPGFASQFTGVSIAPGDSFPFVLYSLTPVSGGVSPGTYSAAFNGLVLTVQGASPGFIDGGGVQVTVVPEPSTLILFALGLFILGGLKHLPLLRNNQHPVPVKACGTS